MYTKVFLFFFKVGSGQFQYEFCKTSILEKNVSKNELLSSFPNLQERQDF